MKRLLFVMTLCVSAFAFADFAKYIEMKVNYTPTAAVDGFPVLVRLNSSRIDYADVKNAGADLKFTDASGETVYPHEVDTWNPAGESLVWVRLPQLAKGAKFRMYYGDATVTTSPSSTPVWQGYELVCHVSGNANDSATPDRAGMLNPAGAATTGVIGAAYGISGTDKGAAFMNQIYYTTETGGVPLEDPEFSYSFWVRRTGDFVTWKPFVGPRNTANADCWGIGSTGAADGATLYVWANQSKKDSISVPNGLALNEWRKIDVVQNAAGVSMYVDGVLSGSKTMDTPKRSWPQWTGWGGAVGNAQFGTTSEPSDFDECRIFSTQASAARIAADYATVKDADFLTFQAARDNIGEPGSVLMLH